MDKILTHINFEGGIKIFEICGSPIRYIGDIHHPIWYQVVNKWEIIRNLQCTLTYQEPSAIGLHSYQIYTPWGLITL